MDPLETCKTIFIKIPVKKNSRNYCVKGTFYPNTIRVNEIQKYLLLLFTSGRNVGGLKDLDAENQWPSLLSSSPSPRKEFVYNISKLLFLLCDHGSKWAMAWGMKKNYLVVIGCVLRTIQTSLLGQNYSIITSPLVGVERS